EPTAELTASKNAPVHNLQIKQPPVLRAPPVKSPGPAHVPLSGTENDRPLLMAGKQTLFQRVLTKPGAVYSSAGAAAGRQALPAFSVLYVYERKNVYGSEWLRVGPASDGRSEGWLPASEVSEWKQSLVLKLTERSGRSPVTFLRQSSELEKLLNDPEAARRLLL